MGHVIILILSQDNCVAFLNQIHYFSFNELINCHREAG
jgi:hypothetical protein